MVDIIPVSVVCLGHTPHPSPSWTRIILHLIQHDRFDLLLQSVGQLVAVAAKNLDAVKFTGVVGGGNHNARIGAVFSHQIGYRRRGYYA